MDVITREATTDDLQALVTLWMELMDYHRDHNKVFLLVKDPEKPAFDYLRSRLESEQSKIFVCLINTDVVGMLIASIAVVPELFIFNKTGYIGETIVSKKYRGTSIGKELVKLAENWLKTERVDHIELQVSVKNEGAIQFWLNQGFSATTYHMLKYLKKKSR